MHLSCAQGWWHAAQTTAGAGAAGGVITWADASRALITRTSDALLNLIPANPMPDDELWFLVYSVNALFAFMIFIAALEHSLGLQRCCYFAVMGCTTYMLTRATTPLTQLVGPHAIFYITGILHFYTFINQNPIHHSKSERTMSQRILAVIEYSTERHGMARKEVLQCIR